MVTLFETIADSGELITQCLCGWRCVDVSDMKKHKKEDSRFLCLAQNFDFVVIDTTRGGYGVISTDHTSIVGGATI